MRLRDIAVNNFTVKLAHHFYLKFTFRGLISEIFDRPDQKPSAFDLFVVVI